MNARINIRNLILHSWLIKYFLLNIATNDAILNQHL